MQIDIVIPVFNALEDTQRCLIALSRQSDGHDVRLIIVDDASTEIVGQWLDGFATSTNSCTLLRNSRNLGYTRSANLGLAASTAKLVVLINNDTIVTPGWLAAMVRCRASDSRIGMVGPLSNAAGWQSVPEIKDAAGEFVVNALPPGFSPADMAQRVASTAQRVYPRSPALNGFCLLIDRGVIASIGYLDEQCFPVGYGEETDYCLRAREAGYELAIADDAYVYHAKSRSFGHARRAELSTKGDVALRAKYGNQRIDELLANHARDKAMGAIRDSIRLSLLPAAHHFPALEAVVRSECRRRLRGGILFILPVGAGGGGAHSVVQEATALRAYGLRASIAVIECNLSQFHDAYGDVTDAAKIFLGYRSQLHLQRMAWSFSVVVATLYSTVPLVAEIARIYPQVLPAYYVQDYEPLFFSEGSADHRLAVESYEMIPEGVLIAKTRWLVDEVSTHHRRIGHQIFKVLPSLDHTIYHPRRRREISHIRITAMIRPESPRRGAARTMRVLSELSRRNPGRLRIHIFGCRNDDEGFRELTRNFHFRNHGILKRPEVGRLLACCDLFIDLSDYQAFGRTALEAMASGCACAVPLRGGAGEFSIPGENALVVDTDDESACIDQIDALLRDPARFGHIRQRAIATASQYSAARAAASEAMLFAEISRQRNLRYGLIGRLFRYLTHRIRTRFA